MQKETFIPASVEVIVFCKDNINTDESTDSTDSG